MENDNEWTGGVEKVDEKTLTFSDVLTSVMEKEGRMNSWLAKQMGLSHGGLLYKFKKNNWTTSEIAFVKNLLNIEYHG